MKENATHHERQPFSSRLAREVEESPTLGQLLRDEATIDRLPGDSALISRPDGVLCNVITYAVGFGGVRPDGGDWLTYLSIWEPVAVTTADRFARPPKTALTILTGEGEMPYSSDDEVVDAVVEKLYQQAETQTSAA